MNKIRRGSAPIGKRYIECFFIGPTTCFPGNARRPDTSVAITGYGQDKNRISSLDAGFDHYFVKPINAKRLTALLAGLGKTLAEKGAANGASSRSNP